MWDLLTTSTQSHTKALELLQVLQNQKKVTRQCYFDDEIPLVKKTLEEQGVFVVISEFAIAPTESHQLYSNKGITAKQGMRFLYIAKDELLAYQAAHAEITHHHNHLGILLGYPDCCIKFFEQHWKTESKNKFDFVDPILQNSTTQRYWQNNIFCRNKDISLISHFPCSLDCKKSKLLGAQAFDLLKKANSTLAQIWQQKLRQSLIINNSSLEFI